MGLVTAENDKFGLKSMLIRHSDSKLVKELKDSEDDVDLSRETPARYAAYSARVGRFLQVISQKFRYAAYMSDVGEAVRPVVHQNVVRATYGVAIGYCITDVAYHGFQASEKGRDVNRSVAHAATFQLFGSLLFPFAAIHMQVHTFEKICHKYGRFTKWGPTIAGLCLIPALPFLVDKPVEHAVDWGFETYWPAEDKKATEKKKE
eukprot:gnl/TRDRNA2_/TRDRNA2_44311_c0_seq1.p1 gnl/TRDRNA2_/TRDRNA2_44311_c0~~gnl/TRDRNA2_/TRDRNA2_44311_c0_seq1.p1  ORF type:complete len:224 (-),score=36.44 gnl/TRDRNA2_/TRDRNA2_44311_c0_seq1:94-708(-)